MQYYKAPHLKDKERKKKESSRDVHLLLSKTADIAKGDYRYLEKKREGKIFDIARNSRSRNSPSV